MKETIRAVLERPLRYGICSNPKGETKYRRVEIRAMGERYQIARYTQHQVFHDFCAVKELEETLISILDSGFRQMDTWDGSFHCLVRISKKGKVSLTKQKDTSHAEETGHNRQKQYIIKENTVIPPLVDLGIFTKDGKIVRSMYDKYRQINRFTELIRDGLDEIYTSSLRVLDFGCGKSYLTFILYYYLVQLRGMQVEMTGLDLKEEVIRKCNALAEKYGYDTLHFETGDINGFSDQTPPDMVVTLHACDTATDYALYYAIQNACKLIYSVPCCQHELNQQIQSEQFSILTRYGLIQERFSALATDAIRGALLEACGYRVQILEFVDFSHSPKNLLIRAVRCSTSKEKRREALSEAKRLMAEFSFSPTLYHKLAENGLLPSE